LPGARLSVWVMTMFMVIITAMAMGVLEARRPKALLCGLHIACT